MLTQLTAVATSASATAWKIRMCFMGMVVS
jgi:hypothetical protein